MRACPQEAIDQENHALFECDNEEQAEFDYFLDTFVGPPTPEQVEAGRIAELEDIDHQMLINAF